MSVRFVHAADIHLGSPLRTVGAQSPELREQLQDATYAAFERIIDLALDEDVDFVVVAGDLYDQDSRSVRANEFVVEQFERLADAGIPAYVCYGNHDPVESSRTFFELPENVHEFGDAAAEEVLFEIDGGVHAEIWGQSYREQNETRPMYEGYGPGRADVPTLGLLHTGLNPGGTKYVPCGISDLAAIEHVDYWALGHIHRAQHLSSDPHVLYPGVPQGRQITEPGLGGCLLVQLERERCDVEFVPTSTIVWSTVDVTLEARESPTLRDVEEELREVIADHQVTPERTSERLGVPVRDEDWEASGYVSRWRLCGRTGAHDLLDDEEAVAELTERLRTEADSHRPFVWTEAVRDATRVPLPDRESVVDEPMFAELERIIDSVKSDDSTRADLRDIAGNLWFEPEDEEDERPKQLPLTDERLTHLLDRAGDEAFDALLELRSS